MHSVCNNVKDYDLSNSTNNSYCPKVYTKCFVTVQLVLDWILFRIKQLQ